MPFASYPQPPPDPAVESVASVLDPVLTPLGFAPGQAGVSGERGQVIFCRGLEHSTDDACVDLVVDLEATPVWRVTDVRYWGHPTHRFHLPFDRDSHLAAQLASLVHTLPANLG